MAVVRPLLATGSHCTQALLGLRSQGGAIALVSLNVLPPGVSVISRYTLF